MSPNVPLSYAFRSALLLLAHTGCLAQDAPDPLIENLFSGRKWLLTEIRSNDETAKPESTVWFSFLRDSTGIREEQSLDNHQNPLVVRSRFRYRVNIINGERFIQFRDVSLDSGRRMNINTEPRLRHVSQFGIRLVQRSNKPCIRLTQASGSASKPTFHYYFE